MQVGSGSTSGIVTEDSKTFTFENLKSVLGVGTCGASDRGDISKNELCN